MNTEKSVVIADLDVELSAMGAYDAISGMPCGCVHGIIHPFIRPEHVEHVSSLVDVSKE